MSEHGGFELVREEVPFHDCGHYHVPTMPCPTSRTCASELCCVLGGDADADAK